MSIDALPSCSILSFWLKWRSQGPNETYPGGFWFWTIHIDRKIFSNFLLQNSCAQRLEFRCEALLRGIPPSLFIWQPQGTKQHFDREFVFERKMYLNVLIRICQATNLSGHQEENFEYLLFFLWFKHRPLRRCNLKSMGHNLNKLSKPPQGNAISQISNIWAWADLDMIFFK